MTRSTSRRQPVLPSITLGTPYAFVTGLSLITTAGAGGFMLLMRWADPGRVVLPLTYPWHAGGGSMAQALSHVWFIFAWGIVVSTVLGIIAVRLNVPREGAPVVIFGKGLWLSINAGFFEEITYRWFAFYSYMVVVAFLNTITFHLTHIVSEYVIIPLANFTTLGTLHDQLYGPHGWMFGTAVVAAGVSFQNIHEGLVRQVNAWFLGMVLFWLMFHYGLLAAVVAHALYDVCIYTVAAVCARFQCDLTIGGLVDRLLIGWLRS